MSPGIIAQEVIPSVLSKTRATQPNLSAAGHNRLDGLEVHEVVPRELIGFSVEAVFNISN